MMSYEINKKIVLTLSMMMIGISVVATIYSTVLVTERVNQLKRTHQLYSLSKSIGLTKLDEILPPETSAETAVQSRIVQKRLIETFDKIQELARSVPEYESLLESARVYYLSLVAESKKAEAKKGGLDLLGPGISLGGSVSAQHFYDLMLKSLHEFEVVLHIQSQQQEVSSTESLEFFEYSIFVSLILGVLLLLWVIRALHLNEVLRKGTQDQLSASLQELKQQKFALDQHSIVAVTDVQGRITYVNSKFCEISGYKEEELIGQDHAMLNSGLHPKGFFKEMYRTVAQGRTWHNEICNRAKDGRLYWVETTIVPFMSEQGKPQCYISIRTDITERRATDERNYILAFHDQLTALPNRRLFLQKLSDAVKSAKRNGHTGALLFIDIDDFKILNDTRGHIVGDMFLQELANRLKRAVRDDDIVARIGGDEFVILLGNLDKSFVRLVSQVEVVTEKLFRVLGQPYKLNDLVYHSSISLGVSIVDHTVESEVDVLKQADIAMYEAKSAGKNQVRFFDPEMQAAVDKRMQLELDMKVALAEKQFRLYYQLQVDSFGVPIGVEALIRWFHPEKGMVSPADFIPVAEETGMIIPIGDWVLETACEQLAAWQSNSFASELSIAINVSAKQFNEDSFVEKVRDYVKKYDIDPAKLKIELTESALVDCIDEIVMKMQMLNSINIQFALDDFGTGYSSLQYLKRLPLSQLKIDQSFVRDITSGGKAKIVRTIVAMARELGLDTIAEGVETDQQISYLRAYGCNNYQGYYFSRPLPADEFDQLIQNWSAQQVGEPTEVNG